MRINTAERAPPAPSKPLSRYVSLRFLGKSLGSHPDSADNDIVIAMAGREWTVEFHPKCEQ
jgi:hypothetical protein